MVQEAEEPVVRGLKSRMRVTGAGDKLLHNSSKDVSNDLEEELTDEHSLGTEIL